MEENKKEEMKQEETNANPVEEKDEGKKDNKAVPTRSLVVWCLGGVYLLYTGYTLCKNVIQGVEGGSPAFMAAGVVFLILGAGLLVLGARGLIKNDLRKKAEAEAAQAEEAANAVQVEQETAADTTDAAAAAQQPEGKHKMSIAERARLADRLGEEEESAADGEE